MANEPTETAPVDQEDGSQEWPNDPDFTPTAIAEQDLEPEEADDDYSPSESDENEEEY